MKIFRVFTVLPTVVLLAAGISAMSGDCAPLSGGLSAVGKTRMTVPEARASSAAGQVRRLICIDPGHPSPFSGGDVVQNDTTEVHINWAVAQKLEKILKSKGADVMLTKSSESQEVDNRIRALMINKAAAAFLQNNKNGSAVTVHLHCDTGSGGGFAIYYPDRKGTYTGVSGHEPDIGFTGPEEEIQASSKLLADAVRTAMAKQLKGSVNDHGVKGDSKTLVGSRQGALSYSIFSKIPTVTIEMVVLSDQSDAKFIKTETGQQKMAEAIAAGMLGY